MMKYVVIAVVLLCATFAHCGETEDLWAQWLLKYGKSYVSADEHNTRFTIFKDNLGRIADLNKQSKTATFATNQFADLTKEEFKSKFMSTKPVQVPDWPVAPILSTDNLPTSFDWRPKGAVTPVKNQEQCGSCWAFSAVANIEGQWFLAGNKLTSLSEQNLVDCDHECIQYEGQQSCDSGCNGGLQPGAYTYVIKNGGIDTEDSYPYTAANGKCSFKAETVGAKITNFTMVSSDEDQMAAYLVQNGPLAIAADAAEWQFYFGGVFDLPCGKTLDHGIAIVGYDVKTTIFGGKKPYWIIKNSWGAGWGEQGYIYVERGNGKCGLNTFVSSAIIGK